jgi:predicted TIM-barrel fold metal-dependent hydrolase
LTAVSRANDCLVNVDMGDRGKQPDWMVRVKEDYFKADQTMFSSRELPELIDEMDGLGVKRAVILCRYNDPESRAVKFATQEPERLRLGVGGFNLLRPVPSMKGLETFVRNNPVAYANVGPSFWGDGMYNGGDAVYYPLYAKACELELPICINTGLPGPPIPGEAQNPIHLDRVCCRFPELKLCMIHGADPWWDTAIRLMIKYANLHLMTSAWAPKYLPNSLLHYMATRGKSKIIFASDSPVLSTTRCLTEASQLELEPEVLDGYLWANSERFFFSN